MKTKIVMCLFVMLSVMACQVLATAIYVENYSFEEPGTGKIQTDWSRVPGWDSDGIPDDSGVEELGISTDGTWTAFLMGGDPSIYNLTGHVISEGDGLELLFDACTSWSESGISYITASLYYDDGGTRVVVAEQEFELDWDPMVEYSIEFDSDTVPESFGHQLGIEFINSADGYVGIDNVRLNIDYASLVYPPDGAINIPIDADLEWILKSGFSCDVYFGTQGDPNVALNEKVVENDDVTFYDPPEDLDFGTTYYWRVDAVEPNEGGIGVIVYPGATWRFTTIPEEVTIITQPQNQTVPVMGTAVFTVEALSPTAISYSWRKVGEDQYELWNADTFTRTNIQVGDEGYYYCILENEIGILESARARLMTERLVGWWELDGDLTDSVDDIVPGAPVHDGEFLGSDPNWVVGGGIGGSDAIEFFGDGTIIKIADSNEYYNFYPQGQTVSAWVKTTTEGWMGIMGKHNESLWRGWAVDIKGDSDEFTFVIRNIHGDLYGSNDLGSINDNEYHLVTSVIDPNYSDRTCVSKLYVDGLLRTTSDRYDMAAVLADSMTPMPLVIGAEGDDGRASIVAIIDEVKVYSYALDRIDIALLYTDFKEGENVCINQDESWRYYDIVGEPGESSWCKVDIEDIAEFVDVWMECALVPKCLP